MENQLCVQDPSPSRCLARVQHRQEPDAVGGGRARLGAHSFAHGHTDFSSATCTKALFLFSWSECNIFVHAKVISFGGSWPAFQLLSMCVGNSLQLQNIKALVNVQYSVSPGSPMVSTLKI